MLFEVKTLRDDIMDLLDAGENLTIKDIQACLGTSYRYTYKVLMDMWAEDLIKRVYNNSAEHEYFITFDQQERWKLMKQNRGEWVTYKLVEVINNPAFYGKLARIGDCILVLKSMRTRGGNAVMDKSNL